MVRLADICGVDLLVRNLIECGASVGLKLLRAGALRGSFTAQDICEAAVASARSQPPPSPRRAWGEKQLLALEQDSADEVLARLLPWVSPEELLSVAAARNFAVTCALLAESGADIHHVEVRRERRRGLVDMAATAAGLDGNWRLVLWLLGRGARPESPTAVLLGSFRQSQGETTLARKLVQLGVQPCPRGLTGLLCDVCGHGFSEAAAMLLDELGVAVNAVYERDGDRCTDRALARGCWHTAEWLMSKRGGIPAKPDAALGHLLDAADEPMAVRMLGVMLSRGLLSLRTLLEAAVQRGNLPLVQQLLSESQLDQWLEPQAPLRGMAPARPLVDLALCNGHLSVAIVLLQHGLKAQNPAVARSDALLHAGKRLDVLRMVLRLLPPAATCREVDLMDWEAGSDEEDRTPGFRSGDAFFGLLPRHEAAVDCRPRELAPLLAAS